MLRRTVAIFGMHLARLDLRMHVADVRAGTDRARATIAVAHGRPAIDRLIISGTSSLDDIAAGHRLVAGSGLRGDAAVRDAGRPGRGARDRRPGADGGPAAAAARDRDGRLLGRRQGRRLPDRAVGDPRGAAPDRRRRAPPGRPRS